MAEGDSCPLCGMLMIRGPSVGRHHLVPQLKGGKHCARIHAVCHGKLHSLWSEAELRDIFKEGKGAEGYWKIICGDERIQAFRKFARKQFQRDPEYIDSNKMAKGHKKRRR